MKKANNANLAVSLKKIFSYMKNDRVVLTVALVMAALGAVFTLIGPNKIGDLTDLLKEGLFGQIDMPAVAKIGIFLAVLYGLSAIFTYIQHYIMAVTTLKYSKKMRRDLTDKINKVPQKYFNTVSQGDVLSRITNDVNSLQQSTSNSLPSIITAVAQFIGCLIMMFVTEWHLALCVIFVTVLGLGVVMVIMGKSQRHFVARQRSLGALNGYVEEMYTGHGVIRISRAENNIKANFKTLNRAVYDAGWKSQFLSGMMHPLMGVVGNLSYVVVCVVGAALAMDQVITFGVIISFVMYARLFSSPLTQLAQGMTQMQMASAAATRVFDFLESEELPDESNKASHTAAVKGSVEFKDVRFAYPDTPDKIIIKNFSAKANPGEKIAIVGPTGAGKTTLVNLLMRFFEINGGDILVDGHSIKDMKREDVHAMFSMVLQDTWLFEGTVRENLVYNMEGIADEDLSRVCRACGIDKFIRSLPHGFDTVLSETTSVSAGQKQLMTIARAMLQNAPMLILDEATSSVDTRTELKIQRAMDTLMQGRTSFVIAHRLSTIKDADLILVMRDGDVVESGNHEELMAKGGFYAELYNSQFEKSA